MENCRSDNPLGRLVADGDQTAVEHGPASATSMDGATTTDYLQGLDSAVERAQAYAERWAEPYRQEIFRVALARLLNVRGRDPLALNVAGDTIIPAVSGKAPDAVSRSDDEHSSGAVPLEKVARALGVETSSVERALQISGDGKISILGRLTGRSNKELQTRYSLVYLYVKEIALGNRLVDIEELRNLCSEQGCYDRSNFTGNFRKDVEAGWLREQSEKGTRARRYMLSQTGVAEGATLLRQLVEQ